jgi:Caspase domain
MSPPPKRTTGPQRGSAPPAKSEDETERSAEAREEQRPGRAASEERAADEQRLPSEGNTMPTRKALVVGVNDYGGPPNDLPSCVNDANAITQLLQSRYGFKEIHTVRDGDATVPRVEDELKWLAKSSRPDDRLVFYFSGHGYTKLTDGVMEEFLVLRDGLFDDNRLVNQTRDVTPGTLTVILDACFSGGMEKVVFDPTGATPNVELAQVKAWKPPRDEVARDKGFADAGHQTVKEFRRFACSPIASSAAIARTLAVEAFTSRATQSAPATAVGTAVLPWTKAVTDEAGQLELNGLLLAACLETETAVASTAKTEGLSAFTHALLRSAERLGVSASTADVLAAIENHLKTLGVRQTPLVLERATPGNLRRRGFITFEATAAPDNLGYLSEPRFWEGVLTAMTPQVHALRAVFAKEGELMSTMYQPTLPNYQGTMGGFQQGGYQPSLGFGQPSPDDVQKLIPILGPILATVIPAVVPPIVNSIFSQQKSFAGGPGVGGFQQTSPEDLQKILPILGPVLANVIPAILPHVINSILTQQKSMTSWGGQALGVGQYGSQPQSGWGSQVPGQELTQTVAQSVNEALRRVAIQTQGFAQQPFYGQAPMFGGRF